jgi:4-alpha-glucanotransferase
VAEFDRFVASGGAPLRQFALFEAIAAQHPCVPWQRWPHALREPDAPGIADFAGRHPREVRFALYLQWLAERQVDAAARDARASGLTLGKLKEEGTRASP